MSTIDRMKAWVGSTRPHNWYGQCAGLTMSICRHFGQLNGAPYASAYAAYLASDIESTNPRECPPGGIHFWDGYFRGSQGGYDRYGHVAVDITGGGLAVLSATSQAPTFWGVNAGLISVARQSELIRNNPQGRYLGWSRTYGSHRVTTLAPSPDPAGGNSRPIEEDDDMPTADEIAKAVLNYSLEGRSLGERIREMPADVWDETIGKPNAAHMFHGKAGDGVALGTARAGKGASRGASILDEIANLAPNEAPSSAKLDELAAAIKAMPGATATEIWKRLAP